MLRGGGDGDDGIDGGCMLEMGEFGVGSDEDCDSS